MAEPLVGNRDENRGKVMGKADLQVDQVKEVLLYAIEGKSAVEIAGFVGCNPETIRRILRGETHIGVEVEGEEKLTTRHAKRVAYNERLKKETGFDRPFPARKNLREQAIEAEEREMREQIERVTRLATMPPTAEEKEVAGGLGITLPVEEVEEVVNKKSVQGVLEELARLEGRVPVEQLSAAEFRRRVEEGEL